MEAVCNPGGLTGAALVRTPDGPAYLTGPFCNKRFCRSRYSIPRLTAPPIARSTRPAPPRLRLIAPSWVGPTRPDLPFPQQLKMPSPFVRACHSYEAPTPSKGDGGGGGAEPVANSGAIAPQRLAYRHRNPLLRQQTRPSLRPSRALVCIYYCCAVGVHLLKHD